MKKPLFLFGFGFICLVIGVLLYNSSNRISSPESLKGFTFSPKNYTAEGFNAFYEKVSSSGNTVGWYGDITELLDPKSSPYTILQFTKTYKLEPLVIVTFTNQNTGDFLFSYKTDDQQKYIEAIKSVIKDYQLGFFGIGIETNLVNDKNPANYSVFKNFFDEAYKQIKIESPNTKVFTTLQLEFLKNLDLIKSDYNYGDIAAFTTYPEINYSNTESLPVGYYTNLETYTHGRPIGFTEIGWNRGENQEKYIKFLNSQLKGMNSIIKIWSFLYDVPTEQPLFKDMGMLFEDSNTPTFDEWNK